MGVRLHRVPRTACWALMLALSSAPNHRPAASPQARLERRSQRTIAWCGYDWLVKQSGGELAGPGPCVFDDSTGNVWVDPEKRLHLRITEASGGWRCAEVICTRSLGYGAYQFAVDEVKNLDPQVVGGLFTWDDTSPAFEHREIDFEYGLWTDPGAPNFQAVVQPYTRQGNLLRYSVPLARRLLHVFDWSAGGIAFSTSETGGRAAKRPLRAWVYTGPNVPEPGDERVHINLWLFRGQPPASHPEPEIILRSFRFTPAKPRRG